LWLEKEKLQPKSQGLQEPALEGSLGHSELLHHVTEEQEWGLEGSPGMAHAALSRGHTAWMWGLLGLLGALGWGDLLHACKQFAAAGKHGF